MPPLAAPGAAMPRHLSPSSASLFEQCPLRWRFRYIDRLPEPAGVEALIGTFAHRVLELLLGEPQSMRTVDRAREIARAVWPEVEDDPGFRSLGLDETGQRAFRRKGWEAIEGLWALEDPASVAVDATEHQVRAELDGVPFLGVIDRIDTTLEGAVVSDYKSGRPPARRFEKSKLSQVMLYAAAVTASRGTPPVRARLLYLGSCVIETEVTPESLQEAVRGLRGTWDRIRSAVDQGSFEPRPGPLCGWCPHLARCQIGKVEVARRLDQGLLPADAPGATLVA